MTGTFLTAWARRSEKVSPRGKVVSVSCLLVFLTALVVAAVDQEPFISGPRPDRAVDGPWNNDVVVYEVAAGAEAIRRATFDRAGVPTMTRMSDGRIVAAHQYFPEDNDAAFDKVAVRFSSDEGRTWTGPTAISLTGLPDGMRFPFDPTLVPLPDGRLRLYFTGSASPGRGGIAPVIQSAISSDGLHYDFEPGARFAVPGRPVIDCAVALYRGIFHLFAPDNGLLPRGPGRGRRPAPPEMPLLRGMSEPDGVGYHATSTDGLTFTRQGDVRMGPGRSWLGNAVVDADRLWFFGTGGPAGLWTATSVDGDGWREGPAILVPAADPGAVRARNGSWLVAGTGPRAR